MKYYAVVRKTDEKEIFCGPNEEYQKLMHDTEADIEFDYQNDIFYFGRSKNYDLYAWPGNKEDLLREEIMTAQEGEFHGLKLKYNDTTGKFTVESPDWIESFDTLELAADFIIVWVWEN